MGIKDNLLGRPDLMIILGLVVVTLFSSVSMFGGGRVAVVAMRSEIRKLDDKLEAVEANKKIKLELDQYLKNFPEAQTVDEMVDTLSSYALEENVKVLSFTPAEEEDLDHIRVNSFAISVVGRSYQQVLGFVNAIENSPYALRLESWSGEYFSEEITKGGEPTARRRRSRNAPQVEREKREGVTAKIELSLIELKK